MINVLQVTAEFWIGKYFGPRLRVKPEAAGGLHIWSQRIQPSVTECDFSGKSKIFFILNSLKSSDL